MSVIARKYIPLAIAGILGFFMIFSFPLDIEIFSNISGELSRWIMVIASFAIGLGAINMVVIHGRRAVKLDKTYAPYSISLLGSLLLVTILGLTTSVKSDQYTFVYDLLVGAGRLTFVSLRGFFMFTAFARAYRARSWEGGMMLLGTALVMVYMVPIAEGIFPPLTDLVIWLLDVPFVGGTRAISIIGGIALVIMGFRIISGMDRSWMGGSEE